MPIDRWTLLESRLAADYRVFRLRADRYRFEPSGREQDFVVLDSPSWVNVIPLTADGQVVLIRQYRHGIREVAIEVPGGLVEAGELPPDAAARELREETGYVAARMRPLGRVFPNPAIQNNSLFFFAAEDCRPAGAAAPDPFEHIEVFRRPLAEIPAMIRGGEICHAMIIAAFAMLDICGHSPRS